MYAWPPTVLAIGLVGQPSFMTTAALSWIAHIGFDHALGYGSKLRRSFEQTTLGLIGRSRSGQRAAASRS
jgi:hypothetical protein